jgi:NAD-reducing hydrogenase small subunit
MTTVTVATVWLDGCSGCHMSLLDLDDELLAIAGGLQLVYSPLVDRRDFPARVDVALVEGAVGNAHDRERLKQIRRNSRILVAFGDCAVTANVPAMRNRFDLARVLDRAYPSAADPCQGPPTLDLPPLLDRVMPVHEAVRVDLFLPGCPPPSHAIGTVLKELAQGRLPDLQGLARFGA